jgi:hypothetical protein
MKCHIYLPSNIKLLYVGAVIGRLLGCKAKLHCGTCQLRGVSYKVNSRWLGEVDITIRPKPKVVYTFCLNYEPDAFSAYRLISAISNPLHLALGDRLVKFFGGMVFYDETTLRFRPPDIHILTKEDTENRPVLTPEFDRLQERIFFTNPLTPDEVKLFKKFALEKDSRARLST